MAFAESMVWGSVPDLVVVAREKEFPGHAFTTGGPGLVALMWGWGFGDLPEG